MYLKYLVFYMGEKNGVIFVGSTSIFVKGRISTHWDKIMEYLKKTNDTDKVNIVNYKFISFALRPKSE